MIILPLFLLVIKVVNEYHLSLFKIFVMYLKKKTDNFVEDSIFSINLIQENIISTEGSFNVKRNLK